MKMVLQKLVLFCFLAFNFSVNANTLSHDSIPTKKQKDSINKANHSPKIALRRSAMLPGWGQVYNKQIWKVPIVYAALGITTYIFVDNLKTYRDIRFAVNARELNDPIAIAQIKPYLKSIDLGGLKLNRRKFRQQVDYSVLFFIGFWGLNMADAVVFAHLKNFDVSDNLSASIKLGNSSISNTTGIALNFDLHKKKTSKVFQIK
jgi:hypothetical protein